MNCPNCKNPIEKSATVCEWCGYVLHKNPNAQCPKCKNPIDKNEFVCKECGYVKPKETNPIGVLLLAAFIITAIVGVIMAIVSLAGGM